MEICSGEVVIRYHHKEQDHLNAETHKVTHHNAQGHDQTRKIDLPKDSCIVPEHRRCFGQTIRKVIPSGDSSHIKQRLRKSVCTESRQVPEDKRKDDRRKQGLNEEPQGSENGLLVKRNEITLYEEPQ